MSVRSILKGVAGWLGVERKRAPRPAARRTALRLEALEQREVPAPLAGDVAQTVADLNRISGFYRAAADLPLIQNDVRNLVSAAQAGRVPQAVYQLQNDMGQTTRRYGSFAPLVSNDPAMQRDLSALLRDVNPGYGPLNYGPALNGLSSPGVQNWVATHFGGPIGNPPASNTYGSYAPPVYSPPPSFGTVPQLFSGYPQPTQADIHGYYASSNPGLQQALNALGIGGFSTQSSLTGLLAGPGPGTGFLSNYGTSPSGPIGINPAYGAAPYLSYP